MSGLVMFFFYSSDKSASLFLGVDSFYMADKAGFFNFLLSHAIFFNCLKFHNYILQENMNFAKKLRINTNK